MLTILTATEKELPIVQQIAHETWPTAYKNIISQEQINWMLEWMYNLPELTKQHRSGTLFFIAFSNQEPVGMASVSPVENTICKLNKLYVLPTIQKTGAGKVLLNKVVTEAKNQGATYLQLQVNRANNAVTFYQKHGFEIIQTQDFDIGNGFFMNDYIMQRNLACAD